MRPDGTRVKNASAIVSALPYIMPRRYDAHDYITEYAEMEPLRRYIQSKRREGVRISYMALILAAYFKAYQQNPKINRFIMNSKIYQRNHFCVSFVILKTRADGTPDETSVKIFFEDGDDVISINRKIEDAVALNQKKEHNNNTDRFANFMFSLPVLPTLLVGLVKLLDRLGLLPRFVRKSQAKNAVLFQQTILRYFVHFGQHEKAARQSPAGSLCFIVLFPCYFRVLCVRFSLKYERTGAARPPPPSTRPAPCSHSARLKPSLGSCSSRFGFA